MENENEVKIGDTRFILEPYNESNELKPHLFIFKNGVAVMLDEKEIEGLKYIIENLSK